MTKNKEWPDGRHTLGGRFLVTVSQSSGDSRAGRGGGSGWAASPATEKRGCQGGEWEEFQLGRGDQTHVGSLAVGLWGLPVERAASNL